MIWDIGKSPKLMNGRGGGGLCALGSASELPEVGRGLMFWELGSVSELPEGESGTDALGTR